MELFSDECLWQRLPHLLPSGEQEDALCRLDSNSEKQRLLCYIILRDSTGCVSCVSERSACVLSCSSHFWLVAIPWTVACQAPWRVHGILQVRILKWVAMPSSGGPSRPRDTIRRLFSLVHWQAGSIPLAPPGSERRHFINSLYCLDQGCLWP